MSVTAGVNAAILTGSPVSSFVSSGKTDKLNAATLKSFTSGSALSASLSGAMDTAAVLAGLTSKGMSQEALGALNKAIAANPYDTGLLAIGTQASLLGSVGGGSSFYAASLSLLNAAYSPKLPEKFLPKPEPTTPPVDTTA